MAYFLALTVGWLFFIAMMLVLFGFSTGMGQGETLELLLYSFLTSGGVAILPTILLYHLAVAIGHAGYLECSLAGASMPLIGAVIVGFAIGNLAGIYSLIGFAVLFVPAGLVAGLTFRRFIEVRVHE